MAALYHHKCVARAKESGLDDHVVVLNMDRKGFRHIGSLGERLAILDDNRIGPDLDALGIEPGLAVAHVEFPAMPGATQQLTDTRALIHPGFRRGQPCYAGRPVERRTGMRAAIKQSEELAIGMEHDHVAALESDHLVTAWRDVGGTGNDVTGHDGRSVLCDQCLRSEFVDSAGVGLENLDSFGLAERRLESE